MGNMWILAAAGDEVLPSSTPVDATNTSTATNEEGEIIDGPPVKPSSMPMLLLLGGIMIMWVFMSRSNKKRQQKEEQMVQSLQKNDKVMTKGGIIGTVMEVREKEVVLKIDESNNTKIKVIPAAIASTLTEETK